jgi:sigma-B regulation protein RsbU (phosphoserine phosphatase)
LGRVGLLFVVSLALAILLVFVAPGSGWTALAQIFATFFGFWLLIRYMRYLASKAIWSLRNRLLVTYLFIAVVPILLIAALAVLGGLVITSQLAVFLVNSELDRRIGTLRAGAEMFGRYPVGARPALLARTAELNFEDKYPGVQLLLRQNGASTKYPDTSSIDAPPEGWDNASGIVNRDSRYYLWAYQKLREGDVTILAPLTADYVADLVPQLGYMQFEELSRAPEGSARQPQRGIRFKLGDTNQEMVRTQAPQTSRRDRLPAAANILDIPFGWISVRPVSHWEDPGKSPSTMLLVVRTRPSAVLKTIFASRADQLEGLLPGLLLFVAVLFLIVEVIALLIGVSMTRTITGAVHRLYEGTQKIQEGDFSHRINIKGEHQLSELGTSFNRMTENLERLLVVAKEKERLQSEIEIAREVQSLLYPRCTPDTKSLQITAVCKPARMVSGDYYDYANIAGSKVALAIGDVAGKGISAALLMATLQSSLRTQLQSIGRAAAAGASNGASRLSTSNLVSQLNVQLYEYTSPEKYATFYFGIYDEASGLLTYTNAGHLPPILVRDGEAQRLEVNGTVVGAFPFSRYDESSVILQPGDLLVCFTDGISEPENAYGEMFGEDRLTDLVAKNAHKTESQIATAVIDSVLDWTGSPELQDDLTLLIAKRV